MTKRDKDFMITASLLLIMFWMLFVGFINAGQSVGDVSAEVNPALKALLVSLIPVGFYALIYYGIYGIRNAFKKKDGFNGD